MLYELNSRESEIDKRVSEMEQKEEEKKRKTENSACCYCYNIQRKLLLRDQMIENLKSTNNKFAQQHKT